METPTRSTQHRMGPAPDAGPRVERIVVGVDGSPGARLALAWALSAAARRGAELEVVSAFPVEVYWQDPDLLDTRRVAEVHADTEARTRALVEEIRRDPAVSAGGGTSDVPVHVVVTPGSAAPVLVHRAEAADLLVVGSRGRGAVRTTLLGSVALLCAASAPCPVVVVHAAPEGLAPVPADRPRVVVGLDDSVHTRAALVTAVTEAARMRARVDAVLAYEAPDHWSELSPVMGRPLGESREQAQHRGGAIVAAVLGPGPVELDDVRVVAVEGAAGDAIVRHAAGAELLVVGSRSRNALPGLVLGSVALHSVVHGPCSVMVGRPVRAGAGAAGLVAASSALRG